MVECVFDNASIELFVNKYANLFFSDDNSKIDGINIKNKTDRNIEDIAEYKLKNGKIDVWVVAWKAGTLDHEGKPREIENCYLTGYGKHIDKKELKDYLDKIEDNQAEIIKKLILKTSHRHMKKCLNMIRLKISDVYILSI